MTSVVFVVVVAFLIFIGVISTAASAGFAVSIIGEFFLSLWVTWVHPSSLLG